MPKDDKSPESLRQVLGQSEQVRRLVTESAEELSSVNTVLKQQMAGRAGVTDALAKNAAVELKVERATEKLTAVNRALESEVRDRTMVDHQLAAVIEQEQASRHASFHDVLTELPNRALFYDRLAHGFAQAQRHGWKMAVMFLDLDKFKAINDTHGHDAGDCVLQTVARRLKESSRGDDTVSRHGGDEFLYLLMEVRDEKNIVMVADKLIKAIQAPIAVNVRHLDLNLSIDVSIGISIYPKDGTSAEALVESADRAMYRAKQDRSGYAFAR